VGQAPEALENLPHAAPARSNGQLTRKKNEQKKMVYDVCLREAVWERQLHTKLEAAYDPPPPPRPRDSKIPRGTARAGPK
jgi:hypothetical protein